MLKWKTYVQNEIYTSDIYLFLQFYKAYFIKFQILL